MLIAVDTRQKKGHHTIKHGWLEKHGHQLVNCCLPYGDYMCLDNISSLTMAKIFDLSDCFENGINIPPSKRKAVVDELNANHGVSVDTKQNMGEVYSDVISQHKRFAAECEKGGKDLWILVEDVHVKSIEDVRRWKNPRISMYFKLKKQGKHVPAMPPVSGSKLYKVMLTMEQHYGIHWAFCSPSQAGEKIVEILSQNNLTIG